MAHTLRVDGAILRLELRDSISRAELAEALAAVDDLEQTFARVPDRIIDLTHVTDGDGDYQSVAALSTRRNERQYANRFRSAIIAPSDMAFGVARMFQTLISNPSIDLEIFRTERDAIAWLAK